MTGRLSFVSKLVAAAGIILLAAASTRAQVSDLELVVPTEHVGLGAPAWVRPGAWTPVLLTLTSKSTAARKVICELAAADIDGDEVLARRMATINLGANTVWLYVMARNTRSDAAGNGEPRPVDWRVRIVEVPADVADINSEAGQVVAAQRIVSVRHLDPKLRPIGVYGSGRLGLELFEYAWTQHEAAVLIRGLSATNLPDRWQGLSILQTLVWTPEGGDPAALPPECRSAVREWVRRGGHLVIVLRKQDGGVLWQKSPLADLLPPVTITPLPDIDAPPWLMGTHTGAQAKVDAHELLPLPGAHASGDLSVLLSAGARPLVVAAQVGLGRVTLVGVDLDDPRLTRLGLPNSESREPNPVGANLWNTIFMSRAPLINQTEAENRTTGQTKTLAEPRSRTLVMLDGFIPRLITMRNTAGPALVAAVLLAFVYLMVAAGSFLWLRQRQQTRHSWSLFVVVVAGFSAAAWGGALWVRPAHEQVEHFTVVDVDGATGAVHAHSWLAAFIPRFGRVHVSVGESRTDEGHTLGSPGLDDNADAVSFVNSQTYVVDAAGPGAASVPMRSTAKQFEADFLGPLPNEADGSVNPWTSLRATQPLKVAPVRPGQGAVLHGELTHHLPGPLHNTILVYCPGDGEEPYAWRIGDWPRDKTQIVQHPLDPSGLLFEWTREPSEKKGYIWRGFIPSLLSNKPGMTDDPLNANQEPVEPDAFKLASMTDALAFFSALPPPSYWDTDPNTRYDDRNYARKRTRLLDITPLLHLRRVIIMGYVDSRNESGVPLPFPLRLDGRQPAEARGWTVFRWIGRVE